MKIVVSWLREFVDVTASPEELGQRLSMVGFELSSVEKTGSDAVLDFEITANRPDCLSVIGLAREAATAYSLPLRQPPRKQMVKGPADVAVRLEAADLCPRYSAAVVDVTVAPSPPWLAERLQAAGVRPINNVVDVTNYVLLELGQPMHAFDLAKLGSKQLRIRRATKGERMKTLDGVDRSLDDEMLVIADAEKAQAIAGVMGGDLSEVSPATRTIVLESACFQPKAVRRTSRRLGLKTEASARFERGSDIGATVTGIERACELLEKVGAGKLRGGLIDEYPAPAALRTLTLRRARIERLLGQTVPDKDVQRILNGLGFIISATEVAPYVHIGDAVLNVQPLPKEFGWSARVPTFRVDVSREADLIEEVGRHYGYDRLPITFPALETAPAPPDPRIERDRTVRRALVAAGCSEAVTFSFIAPEAAASFADAATIVPITNPLTTQFAVLRPSLLPGLLGALEHNRHRQRPDVRLFEIGACITRKGERRHVAAVWAGDAGGSHWSSPRRDVDFFDVKGLVEQIGNVLQLDFGFDNAPLPHYVVPGRSAVISYNGRPCGVVGLLAHDKDVYVAELELDAVEARSSTPVAFKPLPRYPSIARDISIVVDDILPAVSVRGTIHSVAPATLVSIREFDRYQGKGVPEGRVSLSLRLTFRSQERTLTDAEIDAAMKTIVATLERTHNAIQR